MCASRSQLILFCLNFCRLLGRSRPRSCGSASSCGYARRAQLATLASREFCLFWSRKSKSEALYTLACLPLMMPATTMATTATTLTLTPMATATLHNVNHSAGPGRAEPRELAYREAERSRPKAGGTCFQSHYNKLLTVARCKCVRVLLSLCVSFCVCVSL